MEFYVQPRLGASAPVYAWPVDGPIAERDPSLLSLRDLYPEPRTLLDLDIDALRRELPVWGDVRVAGRDLFSTWSGDPAVPGYDVGLVTFALDWGWTLEDVQRLGSSEFDPHEAGSVVLLQLDGDVIDMRSLDTHVSVRIQLAEAWHAVHNLSARVRAFLVALEPGFRDHPQLGRWVRGETLTVTHGDVCALPYEGWR